MFENVFNTAGVMRKGLDAAVLRNEVINNNIANAETPGFKSSAVEFETLFRNALQNGGFDVKKTREKHREFEDSFDDVNAVIFQNNTTTMRMDGNNVDIDFQNAELAKNQLYYNALVEKLNSEYRRLRMAIREGS